MRQRKREEEALGNKEREEGDIGRDRCETEKEGGRKRLWGTRREKRET